MYWLVLGVCTVWSSSEGIVSNMLVLGNCGKAFLVGESGTVVPLLMSAASASWHPPHASASMLHISHSHDSEITLAQARTPYTPPF